MFLGLPDDIYEEKPSFLHSKKNALRTDGRTDGPTDGRTDRPSYRDARTHLKMIGSGVGGIELVIDGFSKKGNGRTDRRTDGRTDGQTLL